VIYKFAVAAVLTGVFSLWQASLEFVGVAIGGIALGFLMGQAFVIVHKISRRCLHRGAHHDRGALRRVHHRRSRCTSRAVLAVVAAGIVRGRYAPEIVSAEMRIHRALGVDLWCSRSTVWSSSSCWQLSAIVARLTDYTVAQLFFYGSPRPRASSRSPTRSRARPMGRMFA